MKRVPNPPPGFDELSFDEKLDYVHSLWDRITVKPERVSVPDWHLELVEKRLNASPRAERPWSEVRDELRTRLRQGKPVR